MSVNVYAIKDLKTPTFGGIFTEVSDGTAVRSLYSSIAANPHAPLSMFPEDYQLFKVGYFDTDTAELVSDLKYISDVTDIISMYKND